jgi:hypothetical protein
VAGILACELGDDQRRALPVVGIPMEAEDGGEGFELAVLAFHPPLQRLPDRVELGKGLVGGGLVRSVRPIGDEDAQIPFRHPHVDALIAGADQHRAVVLDLLRRHVLALLEIELGIDALDLGRPTLPWQGDERRGEKQGWQTGACERGGLRHRRALPLWDSRGFLPRLQSSQPDQR